MKNILLLFVFINIGFFSCKEKKGNSTEPVISALSIIKGQLNHLDTSFYQILKIETTEGKTDTTYLKREEVKEFASDFLALPDVSENNYQENYIEDRLIDAGQNSLSITATAKNEMLEIQRQIIIIPLDELGSGKVESIFIDRYVQKKDSSIQQKLFWQIDKYFQISTIIQKGNAPETIHVLKIKWE